MSMPGLRLFAALIGSAVFAVPSLFAGGPNVLDKGGQVYRWDPGTPIPYSIDQGSLGNLSEADSLGLVRNSIAKWTEIPSAAIQFEEGPRLGVNITVDNYREYFGHGLSQQLLRPENPVIFDDNGEIVDDYLGRGASASVLGFAGVRVLDTEKKQFLSAWVVINGARFMDTSGYVHAGKVITHELGHLVGLDHSQGLPENFAEPGWGGEVPLMYPIVAFSAPEGPIHDDITWVSWLYPSPGFLGQAETGTIRGKVLRPSGVPLLGANVIARPVINGTLSRSGITSVASGFLMLEEGEFELPGLEPGEYAVFIEPINSSFTGGSGIGPYENRPVNFPRDYFDADESSTEDPQEFQAIMVEAGDTVDAVMIVSNEFHREPSSLGDDDEILYSFPEGFSFPFYGKSYRSVYLSSDGILSFRVGDHPDGSPRSESRFLGGPPRIAPLYTDLNPGVFSAQVRIEEAPDGDSVTFYWDQVPEYAFPAVFAGNNFRVSLFRNGDILINYDEVRLSPDPSEEYFEGLNAIVGITPGGVDTGDAVDLSGESFYSGENGGSVYEVFTGYDFDLENSGIAFNASGSQLLFPFVRETGQDFTGFALTNFGGSPAELQFEARDFQGLLLQGPGINPSGFGLESGAQFGMLSREIFDAAPGELPGLSAAWVRVVSDRPELGSFSQTGNGLGVRQTRMDGAVASTNASNELFFTRIYHGESAYPVLRGDGAVPAVTWISLANPADEPVEVDIGLYSGDGILLAPEVSFILEPLGYYSSHLSGIFGGGLPPVNDGYLRVEAGGAGVTGFEFIELEDTWIGLNAAEPSLNRVLYSAQLAHHETIFTSVKVVNPSDREIDFFLKAYLVSEVYGISEMESSLISLAPNQSFQQNAGEIFGLPLDEDLIIVGSIQVVGTAPGLVGDVVFGDPVNASYAASLPLQDRLFTRAVQSHISNGKYPGDPSQDAFTGLALFNPGVLATEIVISAYDRSGTLVGEAARTLGPGDRFSRTLVELVPETEGMSGGFVILESVRPVVAQQLFGNAVLDYLSAVPPAIIE